MFDLRGLSRAQLVALAHGLTVVFNLTENYVIAVNDKGETFAVYSLPDPKPGSRSWLQRLAGVPECVNLCGYHLLRRHLTCNVCRFKLVKEGKLPPVVPVTVYFLAMGKDRRFEKSQSWLGKKLIALVEYVELKGEQRRLRTSKT